jgi:hypothetical protein
MWSAIVHNTVSVNIPQQIHNHVALRCIPRPTSFLSVLLSIVTQLSKLNFMRNLTTGSSPGHVMWDFGGQSGTGADFLRVLQFPLPVDIPPTDTHHLSSGAGTVGQLVADVPNGLSLTPP